MALIETTSDKVSNKKEKHKNWKQCFTLLELIGPSNGSVLLTVVNSKIQNNTDIINI